MRTGILVVLGVVLFGAGCDGQPPGDPSAVETTRTAGADPLASAPAAAHDADAGVLVPLADYDLEPGETMRLITFEAADGAVVHMQVDTANIEITDIGDPSLGVGVAYAGPVDPQVDNPHSTTAWLVSFVPYAGTTKPLLAGTYAVDVGCAYGIRQHCLFTFSARLLP